MTGAKNYISLNELKQWNKCW